MEVKLDYADEFGDLLKKKRTEMHTWEIRNRLDTQQIEAMKQLWQEYLHVNTQAPKSNGAVEVVESNSLFSLPLEEDQASGAVFSYEAEERDKEEQEQEHEQEQEKYDHEFESLNEEDDCDLDKASARKHKSPISVQIGIEANANKITTKKLKSSDVSAQERAEIKFPLAMQKLLDLSQALPKSLKAQKIQVREIPRQNSADKMGSSRSPLTKKLLPNNQIDDPTRNAIGLHGEAISYRYLYDRYHRKYSQKFPAFQMQENESGFAISLNHEALLVRVIWLDKEYAEQKTQEKSAAEYDIEIITPKKKTYIEVKSTISENNRTFTLSSNEYSAMKRYGDRYRFFRVLSVMSETPEIEIIKNPSQLQDAEKIAVSVESYEIRYDVSVVKNEFSKGKL
ncbi:MAG: DUF3883 domain-containing protein [Pseudomonadota bacterium]|nr:DUF3883 domain-containing protein [Pseudomonadota bacterium]